MSVELTVEDLQKWTTAYKDDKGHVATYMKLRQGQKYEDFYLTPSGLMARIVACRLLYSCNTTCAVVFSDCQANARRLTELVQYTTDTLPTTTGLQKGWRQRVERHTQSQLSCWSTGITNLNELQVW